MSNNNHINTLAEEIQEDVEWIENSLDLDLNGVTLRIRTNHLPLLEQLERYFAHVTPGSSDPDIEIFALEREALDTGLPFVDWAREAGKSGRKDSYADLSGGRVVRKIRTGMLFLQSESIRMAVGPCLQYDNQVINFICSQYMNWLQQNQWLVCHASGLEIQGRGVGIAGFSGGGKSTLMLNLLENEQINYLTNDRLFINSEGGTASARGIPKLPRVNPGTIVHNRRLHGLLSAQRREALLQLPPTELWSLEEKYDVLDRKSVV